MNSIDDKYVCCVCEKCICETCFQETDEIWSEYACCENCAQKMFCTHDDCYRVTVDPLSCCGRMICEKHRARLDVTCAEMTKRRASSVTKY